jgi:hypothetical protein
MNAMTTAAPPATRTPAGSHKRETVTRLRAAAKRFEADLHMTAIGTPGHLRDAAGALEHGNTEGAKRHLRAAMNTLQPASLYRHGILDDEGHTSARQHLAEIHRGFLHVADIEDTEQKHLDKAVNAPGRTSAGPPDGAAAGPASPAPQGSRQFSNVLEFAGPKGFEHGWRYVGVPGNSLSPTPAQASGSGWHLRGQPGDMDHIRSISDLGDKVAHLSPTAANALHNLARSVALRDMHGARLHMAGAKWGSKAEMKGAWSGEMAQIEQSLSQVPKGVQPLAPLGKPPVQDLRRMLSAGGLPMNLYNPHLSNPLDLSARTAMLRSTPAPYGKPGGPGLYNVAGNEHSDYFEQVVKALMDKRGMDKAKASRIAWGALRKWRSGGGHVHPEVRAAASGALAEEDAARARAHSNDGWAAIDLAIASVLDLGGPGSGNPGQARVAAGSTGGGQFTKGGGGGSQPKGRQHPPQHRRQAQHGQSAQHSGGARAAQKARLRGQARGYLQMAAKLTVKINALWGQYHLIKGSSRAPTAGKTGAAAAAAAAAARAASTATSTPAAVSGAVSGAAATAAAASRSLSGIVGQINGLKAQRAAYRAKAAALFRQAAKL